MATIEIRCKSCNAIHCVVALNKSVAVIRKDKERTRSVEMQSSNFIDLLEQPIHMPRAPKPIVRDVYYTPIIIIYRLKAANAVQLFRRYHASLQIL